MQLHLKSLSLIETKYWKSIQCNQVQLRDDKWKFVKNITIDETALEMMKSFWIIVNISDDSLFPNNIEWSL
jgi:hypothetical protein